MSSWPKSERLTSLGIHRVIEPEGALPQPAWRLDNSPVAPMTETLIYVHTLHIDSASFTQIANVCGRDTERMREHILDIVAQRGKMHNPATGSGGVLMGTVEQLDEVFARKHNLTIGDSIVSLTSLSWLPLHLDAIHAIHLDRCEVEVQGKAIFFRSNPLAKLPADLPSAIVVAALDVAGAPARVIPLAQPGQRVTVLGAGGTAGLLTLCALHQRLGTNGQIVAVEYSTSALQDIATLDVAYVLVLGDATRPLELVEQVRSACGNTDYEADLTTNVVNVSNTEFAAILLTRANGRILFFNMATSFTVAALGAEGMARLVEMHIGNGYMLDHGTVTLQLLRDYPVLRSIFIKRFGKPDTCATCRKAHYRWPNTAQRHTPHAGTSPGIWLPSEHGRDGAINRLGAAMPAVTDACILCTGASTGATPDIVARRTADMFIRLIVEQSRWGDVYRNSFPHVRRLAFSLSDTNEIAECPSGLLELGTEARWIGERMQEHPKIVFFLRGAFTEELSRALLAQLPSSSHPFAELVIGDGTKIFCHSVVLQRLAARGLHIRVAETIRDNTVLV